MSILDVLPRNHSQQAPAEQTAGPRLPELPPFANAEKVDFMPMDARSGYVASLAARLFGADILVERGYEPAKAQKHAGAIGEYLLQQGYKAAAAFDSWREPQQVEKPGEKVAVELTVPAQPAEAAAQRFDALAETYALDGDGAVMTLHALHKLASGANMQVSPFDRATAGLMLQDVTAESTSIRA